MSHNCYLGVEGDVLPNELVQPAGCGARFVGTDGVAPSSSRLYGPQRSAFTGESQDAVGEVAGAMLRTSAGHLVHQCKRSHLTVLVLPAFLEESNSSRNASFCYHKPGC